MRMKRMVPMALLLAALLLELSAVAMPGTAAVPSKESAAPAAPAAVAAATAVAGSTAAQDENLHLEGEKRYRSNCGRCHVAPPRFAPRMMATIVRHMRVRANVTDQDMRLILRYMTE